MYYAETPDAAHDIHDLKVNLLGESFQFYTDAGVFSKKMIDFGSQVLLSALDLEAGKTLLDVGCGYGPLGISLAKVQGVKVTMIDINSRAIDLARQNAQRNKVKLLSSNQISMKMSLEVLTILFLIHLSVRARRWFIKLSRRHMIISIKVVT